MQCNVMKANVMHGTNTICAFVNGWVDGWMDMCVCVCVCVCVCHTSTQVHVRDQAQ